MKRLLCLMLALTMVIGYVPAAAAEAESTETEAAEILEESAPQTEETTAPEEEIISQEPADTVVAVWSFVDPDQVLTDGSLTLFGAAENTAVDFSTVCAMLPQTILADGQEIALTWSCDSYVSGTAGSFLFTASLPQGFVLAPDAASIAVTVYVPAVETVTEDAMDDSLDASLPNETPPVIIPGDPLPIDKNVFPDPALRTYLEAAADTDGDKKLSTEELYEITKLDLSGKNIKDLTGIHNFHNLTELNCSNNPIEKLDLSGNPNLQNLNAGGTNLVGLDLSKNPGLTVVKTTAAQRSFVTDDGTLDITTISDFDPSKASNWAGGKLSGNTLTPDKDGGIVTYDYDAGNGQVIKFSLKISKKAPVLFEIFATNMTLDSCLDVNFYVQNKDLDSSKTYYAQITRHYADGKPDHVVTIPQEQWFALSKTITGFTYHNMAAKEMADAMEIQIFFADGTPASTVKHDSIRDYCMRNIDTSNPMVRTMMADMLIYGAKAQLQFKYNTGDLADRLMNETQRGYATKIVTMTNKQKGNANYAGSTLKLENRLMMDLYFLNVADGQYAKLSYTDHEGNLHERNVPASQMTVNGSYKMITINDMVQADCNMLITCEMYDAQNQLLYTIQDSAESYCARMNGKGQIYEAVMKFSSSALYYFNNRSNA